MMRSLKDLEKSTISARDGPIGRVKDFYFDDDAWVVRYLVVDAGSWLSSRKVLISPISVNRPNWAERTLPVSLTRDQVKNSPSIDTDQPVTRQNEAQYLGYYGYPNYWGGGGMWGGGLYPYALAPGYDGYGADQAEREREREAYLSFERNRHRNEDPHLRSCNAVVGYHLHAEDGDIGHVAGYLIDDDTWAIRYLVVDTSNWWAGHKVLIAPQWIDSVHWSDQSVTIGMSRQSVRDAPAYDPSMAWSPMLDLSLNQHYGRTGYWAGSEVLEKVV
jgi:hypothetical protein